MGKRSNRKRQLAEAREVKRIKSANEDEEVLDSGMMLRDEMEYNSEEDQEYDPDTEEFKV